MVIITKTILNEFAQQHPDVATALNDWYALVKVADWNNLAAVKQTVNSVDYVANDRYVFNIKGNQYRIVAVATDRHDFLRQTHRIYSLRWYPRPV